MLLEPIFDQKRRGAILEFFSMFDRSWNKNWKSCSSDIWKTSRAPYVVLKLIVSSAYVNALRRKVAPKKLNF